MSRHAIEPGIALVGCDFRVASSAWRSRLVLNPEERAELRARLAAAGASTGVAFLDTCNRTEWIVEGPNAAWSGELLSSWMQRRWRDAGLGPARERPYVHLGQAAVRHFLRVAAGLESFVPGEREVAGQVRRALAVSRAEGSRSQLLERLGHCAGRTVRRIERTGRFRDSARGVHALAVEHVLARLAGLGRQPVVGVAGMGQLGRKAASLLEARGARVVAFNRTPGMHGGRSRALGSLAQDLPGLDALIAATGAILPTVVLDARSLAGRSGAPLVVLDVGIPPQVRVVPGTENVQVHGLDDLTLGAASEPCESDRMLAEQAVEVSVQEFLLACSRRTSARLLQTLQRTREALRDDRLPSVLDEQLSDLDPARRRKLESALRGLLREQHRALLRAIEEVTGPSTTEDDSGSLFPARRSGNDTGSLFPAGSTVR